MRFEEWWREKGRYWRGGVKIATHSAWDAAIAHEREACAKELDAAADRLGNCTLEAKYVKALALVMRKK